MWQGKHHDGHKYGQPIPIGKKNQSRTAASAAQRWPEDWPVASRRLKGHALPPCLKQGMEWISGINLQRVRVHYNSPKPATVQAHAYAQGLDIYLATGQEEHLPHELGHIVQQQMGMVQPTAEVNGVAINDDPGLEQHATELGEQALKVGCGGDWK